MRGTNPIRKPDPGDGQMLDVQEIFLTIQGEGPRAGQPAVFIRLGGCNLACDFCDTEFESFKGLDLTDIISQASSLRAQRSNLDRRVAEAPRDDGFLTVITGGEPLRQNIVLLCEALIAKGFTVQIETNGTLYRELPAAVEIVCSPKNTGIGYTPIRPDLAARITAYKFITSATHPLYKEVPTGLNAPVFVQPMDEKDEAKNRANTEHAKALALANNYRLSLQLHKILGIK